MSPEPTTPTREELLRRIASVFERNGFASWGMLGKEFQDVLREAAEAAEEWAKQHLTSEPAAPSGLTEREANLLRWLPSFLEHAANFLCSDDRAAAMNYAEEARIALKSRLQDEAKAEPAAPTPDEYRQTPADYEELGRSFLEKYYNVQDDPAMKGYICCDSPVEIISHLLNAVADAKAESAARLLVTREQIGQKLYELFYHGVDDPVGKPYRWQQQPDAYKETWRTKADAILSLFQSAAVPASPAEIEEIAAIIANPERVHIAEYWRENMRKAEAVLAYIKSTASPTPTPAEIEFNQKLKFVLENLTAMASLYDGCKNKKRGIKYHDDGLVSVHLGDLRKARALLAYIKSAASPRHISPDTEPQADVWRKPPPHFKADPRWQRQPQSDEEWDARKDAPGTREFRSKRRLAFAGDLADPRAPECMALVSRLDVSVVLARLTWLEARFENTRETVLPPSPQPSGTTPEGME